jgi:hypothetical protein
MDNTARSDEYRNGRSHSWLDFDSRNGVLTVSQTLFDRTSNTRLKRPAGRLSLTRTQQKSVDVAMSRLQPLIALYREEIEEQQRALAALDPLADGYVMNVARACNRIGTLATQQALTRCKLQADIHCILSAEQRSITREPNDEPDRPSFCFTKLREKLPARDTTCQADT